MSLSSFTESATHWTVQKLTSVSIFELRVFRSKNSIVILYTAILGGDVAACHPSFTKSLIRSAKSSIIKIDNYNDKILFIYCRGLVIFFNK